MIVLRNFPVPASNWINLFLLHDGSVFICLVWHLSAYITMIEVTCYILFYAETAVCMHVQINQARINSKVFSSWIDSLQTKFKDILSVGSRNSNNYGIQDPVPNSTKLRGHYQSRFCIFDQNSSIPVEPETRFPCCILFLMRLIDIHIQIPRLLCSRRMVCPEHCMTRSSKTLAQRA